MERYVLEIDSKDEYNQRRQEIDSLMVDRLLEYLETEPTESKVYLFSIYSPHPDNPSEKVMMDIKVDRTKIRENLESLLETFEKYEDYETCEIIHNALK